MKMGDRIQDLCRLCGRSHEFKKDLLDESNKNVLDLIRQFTQITITECDNMPSKVCLDCEEKMVSFQLFILECYKIQDCLRKLCLQSSENLEIKIENVEEDCGITVIKSEVKDELSAEDLLTSAIQNQEEIDHFDGDGFQSLSSEEDDLDNMTIASLKQLKSKNPQKKKPIQEQQKVNKIEGFEVGDFVKLECCEKTFKTWTLLNIHFLRAHQSKPMVDCVCGFKITSQSIFYRHMADHKAEQKVKTRKLKKQSEGSDRETYSDVKIKDFISFKCQLCSKICSSWYTLSRHSERYHKLPPVVHCKCGVTLKSKSVMYKHVQDHKNPNSLSCNVCSRILKSESALMKHSLKHVPKSERKFVCTSCDKVFSNKDLLRSHERSHIPIEERKVFSCDICNLKFTTRSSASSHRKVVHEKVKAFVCDLCGYACGTNGELRQHRAIHSDDKPFSCPKCSKAFKTYSNLKTHMDTHQDTSYVCYVCSRVLNSRRTLRKHLLVHEDKCRHVCSYCNKAFKRRQTLKVHMYTHTGDKPLSCKWCDERFSYASTLRSHRLRAHPDKMAAHHAYSAAAAAAAPYSHVAHLHQQHEDYIKNDLAAIGITKNEAEAIHQ